MGHALLLCCHQTLAVFLPVLWAPAFWGACEGRARLRNRMETHWLGMGKAKVMRAGKGKNSQWCTEGAGRSVRRGPWDEPWERGGHVPQHLDKTILGSPLQQPRISRDIQLSLEGASACAQWWLCWPAREVTVNWKQHLSALGHCSRISRRTVPHGLQNYSSASQHPTVLAVILCLRFIMENH